MSFLESHNSKLSHLLTKIFISYFKIPKKNGSMGIISQRMLTDNTTVYKNKNVDLNVTNIVGNGI